MGGLVLSLPQGQTIIAICDGTNVYTAQSATSSFIAALTVGNGTAANPSISFTGSPTTGFFQPASNQIGFAINGVQAGSLTANGLLLTVGISAGAF